MMIIEFHGPEFTLKKETKFINHRRDKRTQNKITCRVFLDNITININYLLGQIQKSAEIKPSLVSVSVRGLMKVVTICI